MNSASEPAPSPAGELTMQRKFEYLEFRALVALALAVCVCVCSASSLHADTPDDVAVTGLASVVQTITLAELIMRAVPCARPSWGRHGFDGEV